MPSCRYSGCPHPPRNGQSCAFHVPKAPSDSPEQFESAFQRFVAENERNPDVIEHDFSGFVFPPTRFYRLQCLKPVRAVGATFTGAASFDTCIFAGGIDLSNSTFAAELTMEKVYARPGVFHDLSLVLDDSTDRATVRLDNVTVQGQLSLQHVVAGLISFREAVFHDQVSLVSCDAHELNFRGCDFKGDASFTALVCAGAAAFDRAKLRGITRFVDDESKERRGSLPRLLCRGLDVRGGSIEFDNMNLTGASFLNTDVERFSFSNCEWFVYRAEERKALADENDPGSDREALAENYRQLVLNHERKRDYTTAEEFHVGEMETLRKRQRFRFNAYLLYWLMSRYGTSYRQAFVVLLLLIVLFAVGFSLTGLRQADNASSTIHYGFGSALMFTLSIVSFNKDRFYQPHDLASQALLTLAFIVLTAQAAMVLLAIRRRFKR